jgi:hypothetical protein
VSAYAAGAAPGLRHTESSAPDRAPSVRGRSPRTLSGIAQTEGEVDLDLPRGDEAEVPDGKVRDYLLSLGHPVGGPKARYLVSRGYEPEEVEVLERDLKEVARAGRVESTEATDWGRKYLVVGSLEAPDGASLELATVWMISGEGVPSCDGLPVAGR